jgi:hypothetical protein
MRSSEPSAAARRRAVAAQRSAVRISARRPSVRFLQADRSLALAHRVAETAAHLEAAGAAVAASVAAQRCSV